MMGGAVLVVLSKSFLPLPQLKVHCADYIYYMMDVC